MLRFILAFVLLASCNATASLAHTEKPLAFDPEKAVVGVWVVDAHRLMSEERFADDSENGAILFMLSYFQGIAWEFTEEGEFIAVGSGRLTARVTVTPHEKNSVLVEIHADGGPLPKDTPLAFDTRDQFVMSDVSEFGEHHLPWVRFFEKDSPEPAVEKLKFSDEVAGEWVPDLAAMRADPYWEPFPQDIRQRAVRSLEDHGALTITSDGRYQERTYRIREQSHRAALLEVGEMTESQGSLVRIEFSMTDTDHIVVQRGWVRLHFHREAADD